jgi:tetratricopeptide (TPR) repeat protein
MNIPHTQAALLRKRLFYLERCGKYDEALAELRDIWEDTASFPNVDEFEPHAAAEIILRCGSLIGFLADNKQVSNPQEISKNLLTEARNRFLEFEDTEKVAECENYLAIAYWRTGEMVEAEAWLEEALSHPVPNSSHIRLFSYITKSNIDFANNKYEKICHASERLETNFLTFGDDFLKGNLYNTWGLSLKNLGKISDALIKLEYGKNYYFRAENKTHYARAENNLAQLYKSEKRFDRAHEAINNSTKIFKQIKDKMREGFSLDTKAQIYFAEKKYAEALKTIEKAIAILTKSENKAYLVETYSTKIKILIYLDDFSAATFCLVDAVQIAKTHISEKAAEELVKEYEKTLHEKNLPVAEENFPAKKEAFEENLELLLPPALAHYNDFQGVWIKNNHLEAVGLVKDRLAIIVQDEIVRGDLVAIAEIGNESVSCGFYDTDFGIVCLEGMNSELQLFDDKDVRVLGKIVGVCQAEKSADGKMIVEPINY